MDVTEWGLEQLLALVGQEEGQGLDFKEWPALRNRQELVKDVTAMANAAGGLLVYGMREDGDGNAIGLDDGAPPEITREWIEQVLNANIEPRAEYAVQAVPLADGRNAFIIDVKKSTVFAPHQSRIAHRYYRRYGREGLPMYDHEVRDLMRRARSPNLFLTYTLTHAIDDLFDLRIAIGNSSDEPALYGHTLLGFDTGLGVPAQYPEFIVKDLTRTSDGGVVVMKSYSRSFNVPAHLPIFREQEWEWMSTRIEIPKNVRETIFYRITCPGFAMVRSGWISRGTDLVAEVGWHA